MIDIRYQQDAQGRLQRLCCSGHALFENEEGGDLVCAAVSALTGAIGIGLTQGVEPPYCVRASEGLFELDWNRPPTSEQRFLVETVFLALRQMEEHYSGFLQIRPF